MRLRISFVMNKLGNVESSKDAMFKRLIRLKLQLKVSKIKERIFDPAEYANQKAGRPLGKILTEYEEALESSSDQIINVMKDVGYSESIIEAFRRDALASAGRDDLPPKAVVFVDFEYGKVIGTHETEFQKLYCLIDDDVKKERVILDLIKRNKGQELGKYAKVMSSVL